jgi:hypothetical protein
MISYSPEVFPIDLLARLVLYSSNAADSECRFDLTTNVRGPHVAASRAWLSSELLARISTITSPCIYIKGLKSPC